MNKAIEPFRRHANTSVYARTTEQMLELAAPWRLRESKPLVEWLGVPDMFTTEEYGLTGGHMCGAFFER